MGRLVPRYWQRAPASSRLLFDEHDKLDFLSSSSLLLPLSSRTHAVAFADTPRSRAERVTGGNARAAAEEEIEIRAKKLN